MEVVSPKIRTGNDYNTSPAGIIVRRHAWTAQLEPPEYSPPPAGAVIPRALPCSLESPTCSSDPPQEEPFSSITQYLITGPLGLSSWLDISARRIQQPQATSWIKKTQESRAHDANVPTGLGLKPAKPKIPRKKAWKAKTGAVGPSMTSTSSGETSSAAAIRRIVSTRRRRAALAGLLQRDRALRAEEAVLDAYYARHGVDVIKVESCLGKAIYLPWDRRLCAVLDQRGVKELAADRVRFWSDEVEKGMRVDWNSSDSVITDEGLKEQS